MALGNGDHVMLGEPLTKAQQALRGRKVIDMTDAQLRLWLDACDRMEQWAHIPNKARRGWGRGRTEAEAEIERRAKKHRVLGAL
jgi:hypothetical protein